MRQIGRCPCSGATLAKLVQPALLAALAREPLHGYRIAEELARLTTLKGERPDTTGLYRTLKSMEKRGLVRSEWEPSEAGPDRRLYRLTQSGAACLGRWVETLADYHEAIGEVFADARKAHARLSPSHKGRRGVRSGRGRPAVRFEAQKGKNR